MTTHAKLYRWNDSGVCTLGVAHFGSFRCHTIERPWVDDGTPGGKSFESCVPDGIYDLEPFTRPDGTEVYMLVNEELGVYRFEEDVPGADKALNGRWLVLIHVGNFVRNVVGCIAPGNGQTFHNKTGEPMVSSSAKTMNSIMEVLNADTHNTIEIRTL